MHLPRFPSFRKEKKPKTPEVEVEKPETPEVEGEVKVTAPEVEGEVKVDAPEVPEASASVEVGEPSIQVICAWPSCRFSTLNQSDVECKEFAHRSLETSFCWRRPRMVILRNAAQLLAAFPNQF